MLKKSLSITLALVMVLSVFTILPVNAVETEELTICGEEYTSGNYSYYLENGEAVLSHCDTDSTSVIIPSTIDGYPVVAISSIFYSPCKVESVTIPGSVKKIMGQAFMNCHSLKNVELPDSVNEIGDSAFANCENLTNISLPHGLISIGILAFYGCRSIEKIELPDSLEKIGDSAFGHTNISSVTIPSSIKYIDCSPFRGCNSLSQIVVDKDNTVYDSRNNCNAIIESDSDTVIQGCKSTVLPDSVIAIGRYAFHSCTGLTSIHFPNSIKEIGYTSFSGCTGLTSIEIPSSVTVMDEWAFYGCTGLTSVYIPDSVEYIGAYLFYRCSNLAQIRIPDTLAHIGEDAFKDTAWYNKQPEGIVYIGKVAYRYKGECPSSISLKTGTLGLASGAFSACTDLTDFIFPDSVTVIGAGAFRRCNNLSKITFSDSLKEIGRYSFDDTQWFNSQPDGMVYIGTIAYKYKTDKNNPVYPSVVTFLPGTTSISSNAFWTGTIWSNHDIKQVIIPDTVTYIGDSAFHNSSDLKEVMIPASVTFIGPKAFGYDYKNSKRLFTVDDFTINGCRDTAAERYAGDNGFKFVEINSQPTTPTQPPTVPPTTPAKISISDCTITLSQSSYTYDGSVKQPGVTVKYGSKTLTNGTDYTVSYTNNTNAGTAAATVSGKGNYTGSVSKGFTINKASISGYTVNLSQSSYTYDGSAKKPTVTVKNGSKTLTNGTDYSVSYTNNTNVGTAAVLVTGKGNYTGSVTKSFSIIQSKTDFKWGQDNWSFNNSGSYFRNSTYRTQISSNYLNELKNNLTSQEYQWVFVRNGSSEGWLDESWGGSCYGMSSLALLSKQGIVPYSKYKSGASNLHDLNYPRIDSNISSLVTYYQMLQVKDVIQQQYRTVPYRSNETNIKAIISKLDNNPTVLVCFKKNGWGGHAILATGYEYGSWTWNGVTYQGCIRICDPNASVGYNKQCNIYFNTSTYNWCIPFYSGNILSTKGAVFSYIGADADDINMGGYLSGTTGSKIENFVARIDAQSIASDRSVTKVENTGGSYVSRATAPGDIIEDYSYIFGNESEGTIGYNLYDADAAYQVSQDDAQELELTMDYEKCNLYGGSKAGSSVLFDPIGYVKVKGESAAYSMGMTFDEDYPNDWFSVQVTGTNSDNASLRKAENGYIMTADNLENVVVNCNNKIDSATATFSSNYDSVLIYEKDKETIGVRVDTDNNGTYETDLSLRGDTDGNLIIDTVDATLIQRLVADIETPYRKEQMMLGDVDSNGDLELIDATMIQYYLAQLKTILPIGHYFD